MVRSEVAQLRGVLAHERHGTVGDPDALAVQVNDSVVIFLQVVFGQRVGKKRSVQDRQLVLAHGVGYRRGKTNRVLIVNAVERQALVGLKGRQSQSLPGEQVL